MQRKILRCTEKSMKAFSLLQSTLNTRDLGGHLTMGGRVTARDRIWRSDHPLHPTPEDVRLLLQKKITTIIDMRDPIRAGEKPNGLMGLDGFHFFSFPVIEGSSLPESAEAVPGSYLRIACSPNMAGIFRTIAAADTGVMYNCSAGKDRTGVVTAVLLTHCGVPEEEIVEDYMLTKACSRERIEMIRRNFPEVDLSIAIPRSSYMTDFIRLFRGRFCNTEEYFSRLGLSPLEQKRLREKLLP